MKRHEAEQLIEDCGGDITALRALSTHWIGHPQDDSDGAHDLVALLYEYVDESCIADRDVGPQPSDECELTDPADVAEPYTHAQRGILSRVGTYAGMVDEQWECLKDPARRDEALAMLDDLQARVGISGDILAPARAILRNISAPENPVEILCDVLRAWQDLQGLPRQCADEQRTMRRDLSAAQRAWLDAYCTLWGNTNESI